MGTYASNVLFIHVSSPDDDEYVEADHSSDCAEYRHALEEPLGSEHRVEVDRVRRYVDVTSERRQVSTQALCLGIRRQRSNLA